MPQVYRQGDVLLIAIDAEPVLTPHKEIERAEDGAHVLALGEVTGHRHAIFDESVSLFDYSGLMIIDAPEGATVVHEEHAPISLPPGKYERHMQWEYSPLEMNQVLD